VTRELWPLIVRTAASAKSTVTSGKIKSTSNLVWPNVGDANLAHTGHAGKRLGVL